MADGGSPCSSLLRSWRSKSTSAQSASGGPDVVVLTYGTSLPKRWLLGLSAALHNVPLVLVGFGHTWNASDTMAKVFGTLRAVSTLHEALEPSTLIVFADASDSMLVNTPSTWRSSIDDGYVADVTTSVGGRESPRGHRRSAVLVSGECSSYPTCYASLYARIAPNHVAECAMRRRRGLSRACYVNSGTFMASSRALLEWLPAVTAMAKDAVGVEANDDQAAIHRHFLRTAATASAARSATSIDRLSSTFLTLYPCKADSRPLARYSRADGRTECHNEGRGGYAPLDYAAVGSDGGLTMHDYAVRAAPSTRLAGRKTDASQATRRPLIAHANGMHFLLETMLRIWDNQLDEDATNRTARSSRWRGPTLGSRLWPPKPSLLEHPILLVDPAGSTTFQRRDSPPPGAGSAAGPARGCTMRVTTLGDILPPAARRMSLLWLAQEKKRRRAAPDRSNVQ